MPCAMRPEHGSQGEDDPEQALREVRHRFVAGFPAQTASMGVLIAQAAGPDGDIRKTGLLQLVHRMTGLAGTVGFPTVSRRAGELESILLRPALDVDFARLLLSGIQEAFTGDLLTPPEWATAHAGDRSRRVLIVEDDPDQAEVLALHLGAAGHQVRSIAGGDVAVDTVRKWQPDLVLLDVDLPGLDGYSVCRHLKSAPDLAAIPVIFLTTRSGLNERLAGLTLGADEYLCKPVDPRELQLRVARAARPVRAQANADPSLLTFEAFAGVAAAQIAADGTAFALIRVPAPDAARAAAILSDESRKRDVMGRYDEAHVIWMLPGVGAPAALERVGQAIERMIASGIKGVAAGVAAAPAGGTLDAVVAEADEALADARSLGQRASLKQHRAHAQPSAISRSIVVADDDPEVMRIVDSHMRAAGFRTRPGFRRRGRAARRRRAPPGCARARSDDAHGHRLRRPGTAAAGRRASEDPRAVRARAGRRRHARLRARGG